MEAFTALFVCSFLFSFLRSCTTLDIITPSQSIRDGETLVSAGGIFQLGFFSPGNSKFRYLGIWYVISSGEVVWVANRETPLNNQLGILKVLDGGVLVLLNSTNGVVWSSNTSRTAENPVAQLLDSGNLVVKDGNGNQPENFMWQSFDYPCDTILPGMKFGWNFETGLERSISSWKSTEDPARGEFSMRIDPRGFPQWVNMKGNRIKYNAGPWNGLGFTGFPRLRPNSVFAYEFVLNEKEVYYRYKLLNSSVFSRFIVNPSGIGERLTWRDRTHSWELIYTAQADQCENNALCGAYASCNAKNNPLCACLEGFVPKSPEDLNSVDLAGGCVRRTPLACNDTDGFLKQTGLKLPDTSSSWYNMTMSLQECERLCLRNSSCTAYANLDIRGGGSGCLLWFHDLVDITVYTDSGQDLYIRVANSELDHIKEKGNSSKKKQAGIIVGSLIFVLGVLILGLLSYIRKKKLRKQGTTKRSHEKDYNNDGGKEDLELPIFDLIVVANATDNFSSNNKLGEGGFGPVYKGTLMEGQDIAVKRLSKKSGQGLEEFKNEVILIAKLQHRNLVKLLGCCIEGDEKMLIYEFMPNKSLDLFIFDQTKSKLLDWHKRINIIDGIARGLLYLHQDSRLRIIHRDLKTSNILLDKDMNPKISDFGMARTFCEDQTEENTNRVVGTYGYMSPEYAIDGLFSVKSDVFSFGVIILEIVSGRKNRGFYDKGHKLNLLGHAWRLWIEEKAIELLDTMFNDSFSLSKVLRCIHVGLLCVQQQPEHRPNMSSVVVMLGSEGLLPSPKQPGFFTERNPEHVATSSSSNNESCSKNEISFTVLEAR